MKNELCGYLIRKVRRLIEFNTIEIGNKLQIVVFVVVAVIEWVRNPFFFADVQFY